MSKLKHSLKGLFYDYHSRTIRFFKLSPRQPVVRRPVTEDTVKGTQKDVRVVKSTINRVIARDLDNPGYTRDVKKLYSNIESLRFSYACHLYDKVTVNCSLLFYEVNLRQTVMIALPGSPGHAVPDMRFHINVNLVKSNGDCKQFVRSNYRRILAWLYPQGLDYEICLVWQ